MLSFKSILVSTVSISAIILTGCGGGGSSSGGGSGGGGGGGSSNSPPSFTSPTSVTFDENNIISFTLTVSDPDGDAITISDEPGGDGAFFTVNTTNGQVTADAFDFENPQDVNGDNVYEQNISLSDGTVTVNETIRVTIQNVAESPTCTLNASASFNENFVGDVYTFDGVDPDGDPGSYLELIISPNPIGNFLSQRVRDSIALDLDTGVLSVTQPLDAEAEGAGNSFLVQTSFGVPGDIANCSVVVDLIDLPGTVASGLRFNGLQRATQSAGDIDNDGLDELWVETSETQSDGFDNPSGYLIFGSYLKGELSGDNNADIDLTSLTATQAVRISGKFSDFANNITDDIGETLLASPLGDIDGDGTNELLLGLSRSSTAGTSGFLDTRPLGYVLWGDTLTSGIESLDLINLSATDALIIDQFEPTTDTISNRGDLAVGAGEYSGDLITDVVIGLPDFDIFGDGLEGRSLVMFGDALLAAKPAGRFDPTSNNRVVTFTASNGSRNSNTGFSITRLDDLNGDGNDELALADQFDRVEVIFSPTIENADTNRNITYGELNTASVRTTLPFSGQRPVLNTSSFDADNDGLSDILFSYNGGAQIVFGDVANGSNTSNKDIFLRVRQIIFSTLRLG